mgnify:CR=1 FL=1
MNPEYVKKPTPSFKDLIQQEQIFAPCVWDCRTTRAAELCGFKAVSWRKVLPVCPTLA